VAILISFSPAFSLLQLLKSGGQIHVASSFKEQLVRDWLTAKSLA
jgi:hypothetical protein